MSKSFDLLVDGMIDALRTHVLPRTTDEFARGQLFAVIFALNNLKLGADWKVGPLLEQVTLQDAAFAAVGRLSKGLECPAIPTTPRVEGRLIDAEEMETLRDDGDRFIAGLLTWTANTSAQEANSSTVKEIERSLRLFIRDQLTVEIRHTAKSMLQEIAVGDEAREG